MKNRWTLLLLRLLPGLILVVSGALKASAPKEEFAVIIENYGLLRSAGSIMAAAALLPWAELFAGLALVYGVLTRYAAAAAGGLYLVFIVAITSTLARHYELPNCGCFGMDWHLNPKHTLVMDLLLLACCAFVIKEGDGGLSLDNWAERSYTAKR